MTAEVAILNKQAVALAADSAVTVYGGKIFNTANKLYMLAPGHSVGILIFNNANFMDVPWEIIISAYREHLLDTKKRFERLNEYGEDFFAFLKSNELLASEEQQRQHFWTLIQVTMRNDIAATVQQRIAHHMMTTGATIDADDEQQVIAQITREVIDQVSFAWENAESLEDSRSMREQFQNELFVKYGAIFEDIYQTVLGRLPISAEGKAKIQRLIANFYLKNHWLRHLFSGVVFAGYGSKDIFPVCDEYHIESIACGFMKVARMRQVKISYAPFQAGILPFAQGDIMGLILQGIHRDYRSALEEQFIATLSEDYASDELAREKWTEISEKASRTTYESYTIPILQIVSSLTKDELAVMAETLVSITSFMRRVSSVEQNVGGPVDVAVISKKDGFIWIKRKHYFDPDRNYLFFKDKPEDQAQGRQDE